MRPQQGRKADRGAGHRRDPISHCKSCGRSVVWLRGEHGRGSIILDANETSIRYARARARFDVNDKELRSHMETCRDRERWRRKPGPAERTPQWP
jgi:hypothetical protein